MAACWLVVALCGGVAAQPAYGAAPPAPAAPAEQAPAGSAEQAPAGPTEQATGGADPEPTLPTAADAAKRPAAGGDATGGEPGKGAAETPAARPPADLPERILLRDFLVLPRVGSYGGRPVQLDPIDASIATGRWRPPAEGDTVIAASGNAARWKAETTDADGRLSGPATSGGYAYTAVDSAESRVMILRATRHAAVRLNGQWLAGDPYGYGAPHLPVRLRAGENTLLFHLAQPGFRAELVEVEPGVSLSADDATLPDVPADGADRLWAALPVVNTSDTPLIGGELRVTIGDEEKTSRLPTVEPLGVFKAPVRLPEIAPGEGAVPMTVALHLPRLDTQAMSPDAAAKVTLELSRFDPGARHTQTFVSRIDGSVQPFTVVPATAAASDDATGIILALHGLATDHKAFAKYYTAKPWAHIVVPQNRRPFGFDWEDWGAADAMEALGYAKKRLEHDPRRVYVTGHGMGGHGAWRLAMRYSDEFAAVGPSAGWIDSKGAGAASQNPAAEALRRGARTTAAPPTLSNLAGMGVYLLHGGQDQRVSPAQSRFMRGRLGEFHPDFVYYERRGAGHWWGPQCVDWPPMMAFFKDRRRPEAADVTRVDFTTLTPTQSSEGHWAQVVAQDEALTPSRVVLEYSADRRAISGRTENVSRLRLDLRKLVGRGEQTIRLDSSRTLTVRSARTRPITLSKDDQGRWRLSGTPPRTQKSPRRGGLLKSVFNNRPLLVYGTVGNAEENAWSAAKARFDAQSFLRRGNGSLEVVADTDFKPGAEPNRNVVLYGNAETNAAWPALLSSSPVQVRRDRVTVSIESNGRPELGDDLAVLMVRPRRGSSTASVAVVGGTGLPGMRLTTRMRYFVAGVTYPDLLIFGPRAMTSENADIRAAGFFAEDWKVGGGEILWRDLAL
ncbi:MAG: PHB depolymerase family esterase [Planctomycetota bacterium]